jgi:glutathione S-transferase
MELYHNALSTCSQKVRLVLAEKNLDFESHDINLVTGEQHDPEYVKLNPKHVVPTLIHDGRVFLESTLIIQYLNDIHPEPPMRALNPVSRYEEDLWVKRIDEELHVAAPIVTFAIAARKVILQQPEEVREANIAGIPDPIARAARRSVIENGVKAPEFANALGVFVATLDAMESRLRDRPWLSAGDEPGLADATALPYVLRLEHLAMTPLLTAPRRPHVADWFARWRARPSYATAVEGWLVPAIVEMLRKDGEEVWSDVEPTAIAASRSE